MNHDRFSDAGMQSILMMSAHLSVFIHRDNWNIHCLSDNGDQIKMNGSLIRRRRNLPQIRKMNEIFIWATLAPVNLWMICNRFYSKSISNTPIIYNFCSRIRYTNDNRKKSQWWNKNKKQAPIEKSDESNIEIRTFDLYIDISNSSEWMSPMNNWH